MPHAPISARRRPYAVCRWAIVVAGLWVLAGLVAAPAALAHATLKRIEPAQRAVLSKAPRVVRLTFDDVVRTEAGVKAIRNGGGSILAGDARVVGGRQLLIPLRANLARGDYTVLWRARSDDGHTVAGLLTFAVGEDRPPPIAGLAAPRETSAVDVVARWLLLAGVLAASGAALVTLALRGAVVAPAGVYLGGFLLVVAGGPLLAGRATLSTRFGLVIAAATAVAAVGALLAARPGRRAGVPRGTLVAGLLILPAPSLSGHALDAGRSAFDLPVDLLHVAASSVWLGGLLALAVQLRSGRAREPLLRAFSTLAAGSVVLLAGTGVLRAFSELASLDQAWTTGYGRLLLVKTACFGALVAFGWVNRYRIIPALVRSAPRLRRNVLAELGIFAGLMAAVALLTQARPGVERDGVVAAPAAAAQRKVGTAAQRQVLAQKRGSLQLAGPAANATVEDADHVIWETLQTEGGETASLFRRDLRARRSTMLAGDVAPEFGLAVTAGHVVYAVGASPPTLVAMRTGGGGKEVLARGLLAPVVGRGARIAWAEKVGGRQRLVVRDMARGKQFVAAELPACAGAVCYRIDGVTLADRGVIVARGAIGPQPSVVLRREFAARRAEAVRIANDPQPDLVPSSAGAAYFALGRGWRRWDFGAPSPVRAPYGTRASSMPVAFEAGRWYLQRPGRCGDSLIAADQGRRARVLIAPKRVLAIAGNPPGVCARFRGLTGTAAGTATTWAVSPLDSHSDEAVIGVITFGRPGG